ncbi:MAG: DJ-1/PfpI family protein [Muribaculaceae bacterium]|nr:DJ-1/PfpI family protein [Muribaculaceae bacterium]
MKESFIFLADGFEEIEALTVIDVLRRAEMPVKTVSISSSEYVTGAHGVTVKADTVFDKQLLCDPEWLILPGGMPGATNLYEHEQLREILIRHNDEKKKIAAICAAPAVVLGQLGILKGKRATCYPGFENLCAGAEMIDSPVVVDDNIVCGNGPANAMSWALNIVGVAKDEQAALHIVNGMLYYPKACDDVNYCFG